MVPNYPFTPLAINENESNTRVLMDIYHSSVVGYVDVHHDFVTCWAGKLKWTHNPPDIYLHIKWWIWIIYADWNGCGCTIWKRKIRCFRLEQCFSNWVSYGSEWSAIRSNFQYEKIPNPIGCSTRLEPCVLSKSKHWWLHCSQTSHPAHYVQGVSYSFIFYFVDVFFRVSHTILCFYESHKISN